MLIISNSSTELSTRIHNFDCETCLLMLNADIYLGLVLSCQIVPLVCTYEGA